ncbi:uncharacterized protein BX664DRAFT_332151 [Halteromyces radiatus]|uniref:uncharacterized protein n=1 Tax=Halteromyces radiatus TaxID=101107 RepID=UPI00221F576F|nr:uncharacterized protein BX664DRAFT_332151 [Halteromyces radiatus]KAI8089092.1 hypothetical protein BX664DRAFT_332151 [Halteromyces radiatus]
MVIMLLNSCYRTVIVLSLSLSFDFLFHPVSFFIIFVIQYSSSLLVSSIFFSFICIVNLAFFSISDSTQTKSSSLFYN